ncbi:MAG TPA: ATP-binding protein [Candidatus Eisenbacteria bacterium]|nr:ATP-binding protein [Candidatus Eisenbacteria bacterium]
MDRPHPALTAGASIPNVGDALLQHFDRAPFGLLLLGEDRRILRVNEALAQLAGTPAASLLGYSMRRFLSSEAAFDLEDRLFDEVAQAGGWHGELEIVTALGDTPTMVSITPVDANEAKARYVVAVIELGQQRWFETESTRRAAELAAIASIAVATGGSADPGGMLNAVARAVVEQLEVDACWIHRYDPAEGVTLAGEASTMSSSLRLPTLMLPGQSHPALLRALETREQVAESELLDRSIATVVHAPLLAQDEAVGVISILSVEGEKLSARNSELFRTVSYQVGTAVQNLRLLESIRHQQKLLQDKNEELQIFVEELMAADRMKNEFLANTSHELRTPLNSIIGFLNLVLDDLCESEDEKKELLGHALRSGRQLLALINDVLDLSRIQAGRIQLEMRDVDLTTLMDEVGRTLGVQAAEKHLDFMVASFPSDTSVRADESRLRQVLVNVVGNAIKFTSKGAVRIEVVPCEGFVEIIVRDSGIGVPKERMERLFRKFSQADASTTRRFGGSGLGLAIVKDLVELMGGTVRLESEGEGQGTTVTLGLLRAQAGAAPSG